MDLCRHEPINDTSVGTGLALLRRFLVAKLDVERVIRIKALDISGAVLYQQEGT